MKITTRFRDISIADDDLVSVFRRMFAIATIVEQELPHVKQWYLKGETKEEALAHPVFADGELTDDALDTAMMEYRRSPHRVYSLSIWDGGDDHANAVTMRYQMSGPDMAKTYELNAYNDSALSKDGACMIVKKLVNMVRLPYLMVQPSAYYAHQAFPDKPGAGWMLYLPRILKTRDVPEAGELIQVEDDQGNPIGTIIVSVADTVFSVDNPAHLEIAHNIEARLISNGWLPRFTDI